MKEILIKEYNNLIKNPIKPLFPKNNVYSTFINGAKIEVLGDIEKNYKVQFIDRNTDKLIHETEINNNMWSKLNKQYYIDCLIKVIDLETNEIIEHTFDAKDKRVYIHFIHEFF